MQSHPDVMPDMAEKCLRLANTTDDPQDRHKFFDYVSVYAELSKQARCGEASTAIEDKARDLQAMSNR